MAVENQVAQVIESYFDHHKLDDVFRFVTIVTLRQDGVVVYSNETAEEMMTIGALMTGAWQASKALLDTLPNNNEEENVLRFSFDSSSSGVYILPLDIGSQKLFLGMIFDNEINPALLKNKMRKLATELSQYFISNSDKYAIKTQSDEFLFQEISDDEIDNLFSFAGN